MGILISIYHNPTHRSVRTFQRLLTLLGYKTGTKGTFDNVMAKAVREYQQSRNLDTDGIIGGDTLLALFEDQASLGPDFIEALTPLRTDKVEVVNLKATMFDIVSLLHKNDSADNVVKEIVVSAGNILKSIEGKI